MKAETKMTQDAERFCELIAELMDSPATNEIDNSFANTLLDLTQHLHERLGTDVHAAAMRFSKQRIAAMLATGEPTTTEGPFTGMSLAEVAEAINSRIKQAAPDKQIAQPLTDSEQDALNDEGFNLLCWLFSYLLLKKPKGDLKKQWKAVHAAYNDEGKPFYYLLERLRELKDAITTKRIIGSPDLAEQEPENGEPKAAAHERPDPDDKEAFKAYDEMIGNSPSVNDLETIPGDEVNFIGKDGHHIAHIEFVEDSGVHSLKLSVWSEDSTRIAYFSFDYRASDKEPEAPPASPDRLTPERAAEVTQAFITLMSGPLPDNLQADLHDALDAMASGPPVANTSMNPDLLNVWLPAVLEGRAN